MKLFKLIVIASIAAALAACATTPKQQSTTPTASSAANTAAVMPTAAASITGSWKLVVESPAGTNESMLIVTQAGDTFSGKIASPRGERPVSGTIKGNDVAFALDVKAQGMDLHLAYTAKIEGNTMKGNVKFGDMGEGPFTGVRQ